MYAENPDNRKLLLFLLLSILVHLLLLLLLYGIRMIPDAPKEEPVYVEMVPTERTRELDLPEQQDQQRDTPAKRLGPSDRVVEREVAPAGDAPEDRAPAVPTPEQPPQPQQQAPSQPQPADSGSEKAPEVPDLSSLLTLPSSTISRIENEWRNKYRPDVEDGDVLWLDTETDLLISFYQRLRNGIYRVWNYPEKSASRGEQGACLIRMTFDRKGNVKDVELLESSGYPLLDREAVAAVYKGAPYGKLPDVYEKETLTIMAFFRYSINRKPFITK